MYIFVLKRHYISLICEKGGVSPPPLLLIMCELKMTNHWQILLKHEEE